MGIISNRVAYWDGPSFVVVTKNCTKEKAKAILQALAVLDVDGVEEIAEAAAEPVIEPEEVMPPVPEEIVTVAERPEYVFPNGRYKGCTPSDVLKQEQDKGFANLAFLANKLPDAKSDIDDALHTYFRNRFGKYTDPYTSVTKWDSENCDKFFKYFSGIVSKEDAKVFCDKSGVLDLTTFCGEAPLEKKRSAIAALITKYAL